MNPSNRRLGVGSVATAVADEARKLLNDCFDRLKLAADDESPPRWPGIKLFPNGVEVIHVKVEAGLTAATKVAVEVKIAGPGMAGSPPQDGLARQTHVETQIL